ncbi:MAG: hypothetical protein JWQ19_1607 [Subtercola sp.]|nr:hypothetical protein [Subtercola sp.]
MHARVKSIGADIDVDTYLPLDPAVFGIYFELSIGPEGGRGEEIFGVTVCSPGWLAEQVEWHGRPISRRHHLITNVWDISEIRRTLTKAFEEPEAETWNELGSTLSRLGRWEFEDYEP